MHSPDHEAALESTNPEGTMTVKSTYSDDAGRVCEAQRPNASWLSDIPDIRTREGWLYLAAILELYSRAVIGWSMNKTLYKPSSSRRRGWLRRPLAMSTLEVPLHGTGHPRVREHAKGRPEIRARTDYGLP
jgi:transposase InsO family protein